MSFTESPAPLPDEVDSPAEVESMGSPGDPQGSDHPEVVTGASAPLEDDSDKAIHADDPDDEWAVAKPSRGIRIGVITGVLLLLVAVAGGFWGGAAVEKNHAASSSTSSSALSRILAAARAGSTTGAAGSGSGSSLFGRSGFGSAATGTLIGVSGDVLELSTSSGSIVKVTVGPSATVTRTSTESLAGLKIGDTVVVTGSTASNGSVNATAVRASAAGTTTGFGGTAGGLGGSGFGGSGATPAGG